MGDIPRIITGILLIFIGLSLILVALSTSDYLFISGISAISLILGVIILLNKRENKIEEIRKK